VIAVHDGRVAEREDRLAGEEPMAIRVAGPGQAAIDVAITMRTPGGEAELALGFLHSEGLIVPDDVEDVTFGDPTLLGQPDDEVLVRVRRPFDPAVVPARHFVVTASCGICGKASIDELAARCAPIPPGPVVTADVLYGLPDTLRAAQVVFEATGGLHASGLFDAEGRLIRVREDVGRHNALDKLIGSRVLARELPLWDRILLVSGRVSFEIVQKAVVAGIPIICAVSAPSDLAIRLADRLGATLVGFLRDDGFNVYTHDNRIDLRDLMGAG